MSKQDQYQILYNIADAAVIIDADYTIVFANKSVESLCGMKRSEIVGRKCYEISRHCFSSCFEKCDPQVECGHKEVFRTGRPSIVQHTHFPADGSRRFLEIACSPILDDEGHVVSVLQVMRDRTAAEKLREQVHSTLAEYEAVWKSAPYFVSQLDRDMRVVRLNSRMEELVGLKTGEVKGCFCYDVWGQYADDAGKTGRERICDACRIENAVESGQSQTYERTIAGRTIEVTATAVRDSRGDIVGALEVGKDITAWVAAEKELARSKAEWERTFHAFSDIVTLQTPDLEIVKINQAGCETLGRSCDELVGRHCYELFHGSDEPCPSCPLLDSMRDCDSYSREIHHDKLGRIYLVSAAPVLDDQGDLEYIAHVAKDITKNKKMEEQLFLSEKMATIAGLAAGVSHEINTPLSAILQSAQIIEQGLDPGRPANLKLAAECGVDLVNMRNYLNKKELDYFLTGIRESAAKASEIIRRLLDFSRPHKGEFKRFHLVGLVEEALELARADYNLKKKYDILNVKIKREYDPELPEISCVPMEIEQVILNLVKNAVQAMADEQVDKPCITIRTMSVGSKVRIEVEDNGPGMDEETRKHAFDPFFTTKETGAGTGLGLSVSYAIIHDKHGGDIRVKTEPGRGATFMIELPL